MFGLHWGRQPLPSRTSPGRMAIGWADDSTATGSNRQMDHNLTTAGQYGHAKGGPSILSPHFPSSGGLPGPPLARLVPSALSSLGARRT